MSNRMKNNGLLRQLLNIPGLTLAGCLALALPALAPPTPGVEPHSVSETINAGACLTITKVVHTPPIPPKPDIVFLADNTGSMGPALANVKANAAAILTAIIAADPTVEFGVASYFDPAFVLGQAITSNDPAVIAAINAWVASGGGDAPEGQLNALYQLATSGGIGYRSGSTKIIVWFGDSNGHDPSNGHSLADVISALTTAGIRVIAIPVTGTGGNGLDTADAATLGHHQASEITAATGGVLMSGATPDQVADAILAGLGNLPVTVSPQGGTCDPNLTVSFSPASATVTSGQDATLQETICVAADAPQCAPVQCSVNWLLDGKQVLLPDGTVDPAFVQSITVTIPDVTPPEIICPANITVCNDTGLCSAVVKFTPKAGDNCGLQSVVSSPPSGSTFPKGTTPVTITATDTSGNTAACTFTVTVNDCEPPVVDCVPATNPNGNNIPPAGDNPKSGQNPDGFYQLVARDNCDDANLAIWVKDSAEGPCGGSFGAGPYKPGDIVKLTQSPGQNSVKPMAGVVVAHINTKGEPVLVVTDSSGNTTCHVCFVPPPPK